MAKDDIADVNSDDFWAKVKKFGRKVPFATDAVAMYFALLDHRTSKKHKAVIAAALVYWLMPFDVVPDFIVSAGQLDDLTVIAAALLQVRRSVRPEHFAKARAALGLPEIKED
ncbi:MAG: hypothetical protein RL410_153 [Actinomycetota bacterium]|jgi:uncharacterized membrane protein YkvA (DUF1232 family)